MKKDYCEILGLPKNATTEQIKKAYRKKAFEFHPDKNKSVDAEKKFIQITEAYQFLTSTKRRLVYYNSNANANGFNNWTDKVRREAQREARMSFENYNKKRKAQDLKDTLIARIVVIGFFAIFITITFFTPWIAFGIFVISLVVGILGTIVRSIKNGVTYGDPD